MSQAVQSLRVLQLSKFYPPVPGGLESVVYELTEGLARHGAAVEVLCANTCRDTVEDRMPYPVVRAASWGKLLSTSMSPVLVRELLRRRERHDVIHVHLPDPMANLALYMARPTAKIVVHWHSDIVNQKRALKLYAPLQDWLLQRADAVIATSQAYAQSSPWLQAVAHKVHVVPIGIQDPAGSDHAARRAAAAALRQQHPGKRLVFALGRATYYKGFDVLIRAATRLPADVRIIIGGEGELSQELRELAQREGVTDKVHFAGRILQADMSAYYEAADVFCLPSLVRSEAFGVVLLEAMAHSRAIVATNIAGSGVPWVNLHGETGLNVEPGDPVALAAALQQLLHDDALRARLGQCGRRRFESEFTATTMVEQVIRLYGELLQQPAGWLPDKPCQSQPSRLSS